MSGEKKAKGHMLEASAGDMSMEHAVARIKARINFGMPNQRALVLEGEAGCGKSEVLVSTIREMGLDPVICPGLGAQQQEEFLALVRLAEDKDGKPTIIQAVHENILPTQKLVDSGKYTFVNQLGEKRTIIPWVIDEVFTGNISQMNQLRGFLTFRQSGTVRIPFEVMIFGTTNPEDVIYSSRKSVDAAVMDRVETMRVFMPFEQHQRYLSSEEAAGRYPEVCRLFLRMDENKDLWRMASPRFWHQGFGLTWNELVKDRDMPDEVRMLLFENTLTDYFMQIAQRNQQRRTQEKIPMTANALIARFLQFISHGNDPRWYPISANKIVSAAEAGDKDVCEKQIELFKHWSSENLQNFIGVTVGDLIANVSSNKVEVTEPIAKHIAALLQLSGPGLACQFIREFYGAKQQTDEYLMTYNILIKTPLAKPIAEAMAKQDKMARDIRNNSSLKRK